MECLDLTSFHRAPECFRCYLKKPRGIVEVKPRFDSVVSRLIDGDAVIGAQRGDTLARPAIAIAGHQPIPVQDAGDEIVVGDQHQLAYGGNHIGIIVEPARASFMFDCAAGSYDGQITLGRHGDFSVVGTWANGGNAVGVDHTPKPARYTGTATSSRITFSLFMPPESVTPIDVYDATLGVAPQIAVC